MDNGRLDWRINKWRALPPFTRRVVEKGRKDTPQRRRRKKGGKGREPLSTLKVDTKATRWNKRPTQIGEKKGERKPVRPATQPDFFLV